jgi:hypothetical protein
MIRYTPSNQLSFSNFKTPFDVALDENNRWVKFSQCIPWDALADIYSDGFSHTGRPGKDPRLVIGAMIIKHKLCLSDEETVEQIQENPYLQYFVGFPAYTTEIPFVPSLFVDIRKRMDKTVFTGFEQAIIDVVDEKKATTKRDKSSDDEPPASPTDQTTPEEEAESPEQTSPEHQGKLILDATVAPQQIRFPTDISLLNEARVISEQIIDTLYPHSKLSKKPRTYRQRARKDFLALVKQRRPRIKVRRKAIRKQLNYLKRNLKHIDRLWEDVCLPILPCSLEQCYQSSQRLSSRLLNKLWVIQILYQQQQAMYESKTQRCDNRIISIHQPHVRPILRGKPNRSAEFGAKLNASLNGDGIACLDEIRWDAFNEGQGLITQVENYKNRHGHYPEVVLADPIYGTRANRKYLKEKSIRYGGKPLGRPKKVTEANKAQLQREKRQRREDYRQRIPIEGKFGQGKNGYDLNLIKAKTRKTSEAWIAAIFFVMNLLVLSKRWDIFVKRWRVIGCLLCAIGLLRLTKHRMTHFEFEL